MSISSRSARPSASSFLLVVVLLMRLQRGEAAESLRERVGDADEEGLASAFAACITHVRLLEPGVEDALKSDALERGVGGVGGVGADPLAWADRIRKKSHTDGWERGLKRERKLLLRKAPFRFGRALALSMASLLEAVTDADRLEDIGEWLQVCDSGEEFLARLRQV